MKVVQQEKKIYRCHLAQKYILTSFFSNQKRRALYKIDKSWKRKEQILHTSIDK